MRRFLNWLTGATKMRKILNEHDRKMRMLKLARINPLAVDREEFRRLWAKEINRKGL